MREPEMTDKVEQFFRHATWMTQDEIATDARLLLRECVDVIAQLRADLASVRQERDEMRQDLIRDDILGKASEAQLIAALLSDRSEVGTYAKVEGLLAEYERLAAPSADQEPSKEGRP